MKNIDQIHIFFAEYEAKIKTNNRSQKTLITYKMILKDLIDWNSVDELLEQVNFLIHKSENYSQNTLLARREVFKIFCDWFSKRNQVFIPFDAKVEKFRVERGTRQSYSEAELELLLNELENFDNVKFAIIFKILALTGLRVSELENIKWDELVTKNFTLLVKTSKNNNPRPIYIPTADDDISEAYKNLRSEITENINSLKRYRPKTIKNTFLLFKDFVKQKYPDFPKMISAHILRHYFATHACKNLDGNVEIVSKLMGHTNSNTTANTYINFDLQTNVDYIKTAQLPSKTATDIRMLKNEVEIWKAKYEALKLKTTKPKYYSKFPNATDDLGYN